MRAIVKRVAVVVASLGLINSAQAGIFKSKDTAPYPGRPYTFPGKPVRHGSSVINLPSTPTRFFDRTFTGGAGAAATVYTPLAPKTSHSWFGK